MTLIVAIPARDGIIFGSDSQVTTGAVRATSEKIFKLNGNAVWGASGELALIQRIQESLEAFPNRTQPLTGIRDNLAGLVKDGINALLQLDFRTQFFTSKPDALLDLHPADFLFVEYRDRARVLHITADGTPEWVDGRFAATGNGDLFAHALMQKYTGVPLTCDQAKLVTYKVLEEAIAVGSYGLGPPINIWQLSAAGAVRASAEEILALEDNAEVLRKLEIQLVTREQAEPSAVSTASAVTPAAGPIPSARGTPDSVV